jgi:hypothetical protein
MVQYLLIHSIIDDWHVYIIGLQFQFIVIKIQSYIIAISNLAESNIKLSDWKEGSLEIWQ